MNRIRPKNEVKRKQILDAATQLFTENGYVETSMDTIAKLANVSKQTVYSHFGNKEELFSASIEQKCIAYDLSQMSFQPDDDLAEFLLELATRFFDLISSKEAMAVHKICAYESASYPELSELFYRAGPEPLVNEVTELFAHLNKIKVLNIVEPRTAAVQFLSMMRGEAWLRLEFNLKEQLSPREIKRYLEQSVAFFIKGYQ
ncbi:TetR/AcrR family transcriptional regulator [Thalassotalea sp. LPB0316]|uniref:TetR/AcrR family transcriptional regulator n=1 Tax=Thalassotalea sp. LPB0316 TaxID=2769490 RepID=UPI001867F493|nr:TetR/AcrR family transcriptional regulator [Thalassotalea sp. LPB0316]QOL26803.1 TetR/AcrR family transcriptional regulator [Thalassotalea sp. LPB0316]